MSFAHVRVPSQQKAEAFRALRNVRATLNEMREDFAEMNVNPLDDLQSERDPFYDAQPDSELESLISFEERNLQQLKQRESGIFGRRVDGRREDIKSLERRKSIQDLLETLDTSTSLAAGRVELVDTFVRLLKRVPGMLNAVGEVFPTLKTELGSAATSVKDRFEQSDYLLSAVCWRQVCKNLGVSMLPDELAQSEMEPILWKARAFDAIAPKQGAEAWRQNLRDFSDSCYATWLFNRG